MLATYARAGGRDAALLIHSEDAGAGAIEALGRGARIDRGAARRAGARAAAGRLAHGVGRHRSVAGGDRLRRGAGLGAGDRTRRRPRTARRWPRRWRSRRRSSAASASRGEHLRIVGAARCRARRARAMSGPARAARGVGAAALGRRPGAASLDAALRGRRRRRFVAPRRSPCRPTSGRRSTWPSSTCCAKRRRRPTSIALPAPAGRRARSAPIVVDKSTCTLCLACVGACPEGALADNPDSPQLTLHREELRAVRPVREHLPRGRDHARAAPVAGRRRQGAQAAARAATRPSRSAACAAASRSARCRRSRRWSPSSAGHSMFQGRAAERLKMCGDCRVIDLHSNPNEVRITEL